MITGHVPFDGESLGEILMKHLTAQPDLSPIGEPYRTAIARALAKDPEQRVQSVAQFMALVEGRGQGAGGRATEFATLLPDGGRPAPGDGPAFGVPPAFGAGLPTPPSPRPQVSGATPRDDVKSPAAASTPLDQPQEIPILASPIGGELPGRTPVRAEAIEPPVNEEPIWRLVRQTSRDIRLWWNRANLAAWQRLLILLAAMYVLLHTAILWFPLLVTAAFVYGVYWIVWASVLKPQTRSGPAPMQPAAVNAPPIARRFGNRGGPGSPTYQRWQNGGPPLLPPLSPRKRAAELVGSMFASAIVALLVALVMVLIRGGGAESHAVELNQYAWLALSAIAGSWGVLIPAKLWQGGREDATLRRFMMLAIGLIVGAAAYGIQSGLFVPLHYEMNDWALRGGAQPRLAEFLRRRRQTVGLCVHGLLCIPIFHSALVAAGRSAAPRAAEHLVDGGRGVLGGDRQFVVAVPAALGLDAGGHDLDRRANGERLGRSRTGEAAVAWALAHESRVG